MLLFLSKLWWNVEDEVDYSAISKSSFCQPSEEQDPNFFFVKLQLYRHRKNCVELQLEQRD